MSDNTFGARGMHEAEANNPGFVYRNGWTHLTCPDCADIIYDDHYISDSDKAAILAAHRVSCPAPLSSMPPQLPLWHRLIRRLSR